MSKRAILTTILILAGLGAWLLPNWADIGESPRDNDQNKCPEGSKNDPKKIDRPAHDGKVVTINLTNSGEFVRRCDLTDALFDLNWDLPKRPHEVRPRVKPDAKPLPKLTVLYVHGWKHNGSPDDFDYKRFQKFVGDIKTRNPDKQVLGVYVGWNGAPTLPPFSFLLLDNLSFWSKEHIADRIAQAGVVTKIVSSIGAMRTTKPEGSDQFIAIGHSFGARLLFSAAGQTLIYEVERAHPGYRGGTYRVTAGPTNAVILLNPAFEASIYTSLDDVFRNDEAFDAGQKPLLLTVSSRADWATTKAFPVGQWLGFARGEQERTTLGNYACYHTHSLELVKTAPCVAGDADLSNSFQAANMCLRRLDTHCDKALKQDNNPFIVATTSGDIISGHNDIWNPQFSEWLLAYVDKLQQEKSKAE